MLKWLGGLVDSNDKELRRLQPLVDRINEFEPEYQELSADALKAKTAEFRARLDKSVADVRQELVEAKRELEESRKPGSTDSGENEYAIPQQQRLEDRIKQLEKELDKKEREILDELLPEAFAAIREAARRTIGQRHFDVQLMGGIVLHQGKIAEMKTGEGKTLVATLPLYLNALTSEGCHLATVNDYLARRDPYWMGPIYAALGISVASIYPQTASEQSPSRIYDPAYDSGNENDPWRHFRPVSRKEAYKADIVYGTSSELGFDYLRDNMVVDINARVQREIKFCIVDEVDNLLIDEARTPLIISGPAEEAGDTYKAVNEVVSRMQAKIMPHQPKAAEEKDEDEQFEEQFDYIVYEKERHVKETSRGQEKMARAFSMKVDDLFGSGEHRQMNPEEAQKLTTLRAVLRQSMIAHALYQRDRDYVVKDGEIIIVDEFTGRLMFGRRYSEGLHQAIEAKERVRVQRETLTYATITIQNYFRMYGKLAGMTGTAVTEAEEFHKIYELEVVEIPTNKPMIREDFSDRIYKDEETKFRAVISEVEEKHKQKQPVLIGTVSIEKSERLSDMLKRKGIPHQVLNAKLHEKEAGIIAQAGRLGAVTVATNMAGRGVDIILGGIPAARDEKEWKQEHDEVIRLGGLHIIGTERHEARRIDNQLRGRAGRQGDPGSARFYVSLEDDIMKRFGGDRIKGLMEWAGIGDTPIENKLVTRTIENAQVRVEGYYFDVRKQLVEYDDVVNKHRELIYTERHKILSGADLKSNIISMMKDEIQDAVAQHIGAGLDNSETLPGLLVDLNTMMPIPPSFTESLVSFSPKEIEEKLSEYAETLYEQKEKELTPQNMRLAERLVMLRIMDTLWVEHLTAMEHMRLEAGWQQLRQVRAVDAYRSEGYKQFQTLTSTIRHDVAHTIFHVNVTRQEAPRPQQPARQAAFKQPMSSPMTKVAPAGNQAPHTVPKVAGKKVGRNDPCPCGSGKKYKFCCGR